VFPDFDFVSPMHMSRRMIVRPCAIEKEAKEVQRHPTWTYLGQ